MTNPWALTRRSLPIVVMYMAMGLSPLLFEPAYFGYIIAYGLFAVLCAQQVITLNRERRGGNPLVLGWTIFAGSCLLIMLVAKPALRDVVRDVGAIASILFGLIVIPRALGRDWERPLFAGLSTLSMIISVWTIGAAAKAYLDGAGAYEWRGEYVPFAHTWLPYLIVVEYIRSRSGADVKASAVRIGICLLALLLSLSRTGIGLIAVFGAVTFAFNARQWLFTGRGLLMTGAAVAAAAIVLPQLWGLDVVQQRVAAGVGSSDLSLGWRAMEQKAAVDYLNDGGLWRWMFGYGVGARMPLPIGVLDFAGNSSIPHLHNSYYTYVLKFGVIGTIWILLAIAFQALRAHLARGGVPAVLFGGTWILLMVMGTGVTLQGMTEWSHLTFFGIACALLGKATRAPRMVRLPVRADLPTSARIGSRTPPTSGRFVAR